MLSIDTGAVTPGAEVAFDLFGNAATLVTFDPVTMAVTVEGLVAGSVSFGEAALSDGEPVTGSVTGTLLEPLGS